MEEMRVAGGREKAMYYRNPQVGGSSSPFRMPAPSFHERNWIMPSVQTLVADLNAVGRIAGIGAKPNSSVTTSETEISGTCRVKNKFVNMKASLSETNRLSCQEAVSSPFNGTYIHFEDDWSTIGDMDINHTLAASGNFSGCTYKIFQSAPAVYKCAHIARPGGRDADALVNLMDNYAKQKGWTEIQSVPTVGLIGVNGCTEVFVVSQLFHNQRIDTIRLAINSQGLIVGRTLYSKDV